MLNSLQENDDFEEQRFNETANFVNNSQKAILITNRSKGIIKTHNKKGIGYICKLGQLLKKFKDTEHFFDNVDQSRSTIYFEISLYKFLNKYSLLKNSTLQSNCFKNFLKLAKFYVKKIQLLL